MFERYKEYDGNVCITVVLLLYSGVWVDFDTVLPTFAYFRQANAMAVF
jgi:hypothetical protein